MSKKKLAEYWRKKVFEEYEKWGYENNPKGLLKCWICGKIETIKHAQSEGSGWEIWGIADPKEDGVDYSNYANVDDHNIYWHDALCNVCAKPVRMTLDVWISQKEQAIRSQRL